MNVKLVFNQWVVFVGVVLMVHVLEEEVSNDIVYSPLIISYFLTIVCRGVDTQFLPGEVQRFSGCVIVNGNLIFNRVTYEEFT